MRHRLPRILSLVVVFAALLAMYRCAWHPWFVTWGATQAEVQAALPGDELVTTVGTNTTRAITINVPATAVWPWLAQLGQDRGGFYSYEVLEDLVGTHMTNADRILPDRQQWHAGDKLWMYPPDKLGGVGGAPLRVLEEGRALVFATRHLSTPQSSPENGTWAFVLQPLTEHSTRLIVRGRGTLLRSSGWRTFDTFVFDPIHFVMERKMMVGIAQRAEGGRVPSDAVDAIVVLSWCLLAGLGIASIIATLRRADWLPALACTFAAGLFFQVATFIRPGLVITLALVALLAIGLWQPRPAMRVMAARAAH